MTDIHRRPFNPVSFAYLVNPVGFIAISALILALMTWSRKPDSSSIQHHGILWIFLLAGFTWMLVYGARFFHYIAGYLPHHFEVLMPYRFSNLSAMLLIPLTVTAIAYAYGAMRKGMRSVTMFFLVSVVLFAVVGTMIEEGPITLFYKDFIAHHLIFLLWGFLFGIYAGAFSPRGACFMITVLGAVLVGGSLLMFSHFSRIGITFIASFLLVGGASAAYKLTFSKFLPDVSSWNPYLRIALFSVCILTAAVNLSGQDSPKWTSDPLRWEVISPYDRKLAEWLGKNAEPNELILSPIYPDTELQSKTGHPVLMEQETLWGMTYIPAVAANVGLMAQDLYGVDYSDHNRLLKTGLNGYLPIYSPIWLDAWKHRTLEQWQALAQKYTFRLVLSPTKIKLDLPVALPGRFWTLYIIPDIFTQVY
jgi:hypothetical protein